VAGFARKQGIQPEDLAVESTAKGEYYVYTKKVQGRQTIDILAEALPGVILGIYFPKTMYWTGKGGPRFIRPIRWIVALLGEDIVSFELAGVRSGSLTAGHRRLGAREIRTAIPRASFGAATSACCGQGSMTRGSSGTRIRRRSCAIVSRIWPT